jgi:hypothetical protein
VNLKEVRAVSKASRIQFQASAAGCRMRAPARWRWAVLGAVLLGLMGACGGASDDPFAELYHPDSRQTLQVLGELELRPRDAADERVDPEYSAIRGRPWLYRSGPWERMPADMHRVLGKVSVEQARQGVSVVVDVMGKASSAKRTTHIFASAPLRIDIICQPGAAECESLDRERHIYALPGSERTAIPLEAQVEIQDEHDLLIDGEHKRLSVGRKEYAELITPAFPAEVRVAFWPSEDLHIEQLRIRLLQHPYSEQPPHPHLAKGPRIALLLASLALAFASLLRRLRSEPFDNEEAPRSLGLLIAIFGLLMLVASWQIDSLYYALLGFLLLLTGRLLYFGQVAALLVGFLLLLFVWSWSVHELGVGRDLLARVLLPTVLVGYLLLGGVSKRLGRIERDWVG